MPSENSRYLKRRRGPRAPMELGELRELLPALGLERLSELLWIRADRDSVLRKTLMAAVAIRLASNDLDKAKEAIDYALHFPDYVRCTDGGHGQILEEIKICLENLAGEGHSEFSIQVSQYTLKRGEEVAENFEDDWEWSSSLKNLSEWTEGAKKQTPKRSDAK